MELYRGLKGEFCKMRHTSLFLLHLLLPLLGCLVFLWYFSFSRGRVQGHIGGFIQAVGCAYPFAASLVCAKAVALEGENHFQVFLGTLKRKETAFFAKWLSLELLGFAAVFLTVFGFALGYHGILGREGLSFLVYGKAVLVLWMGSIPLYLEHLFFNLQFSGAISMGIGLAQSLTAALFLTGLGEERWQFVPCTWPARGGNLLLLSAWGTDQGAYFLGETEKAFKAGLLLTALLCVIILAWFYFYEGRQRNE